MYFTCIECEEQVEAHLMDTDERTCFNCLNGIREHGMLDNEIDRDGKNLLKDKYGFNIMPKG